jgi:hypothetical protein
MLAALAAIVPASPAAAGTVIACNQLGHIRVSHYTTAAGNYYEILAHNCLEENAVAGEHWYNSRTHWHCLRNDVSWDGCRINSRLAVQKYISGTGWSTNSITEKDVTNPTTTANCTGGFSNGGFFSDSTTEESYQTYFDGLIRGVATDPDNVRFCLADGTSVVVDVTDSVSEQFQIP